MVIKEIGKIANNQKEDIETQRRKNKMKEELKGLILPKGYFLRFLIRKYNWRIDGDENAGYVYNPQFEIRKGFFKRGRIFTEKTNGKEEVVVLMYGNNYWKLKSCFKKIKGKVCYEQY